MSRSSGGPEITAADTGILLSSAPPPQLEFLLDGVQGVV